MINEPKLLSLLLAGTLITMTACAPKESTASTDTSSVASPEVTQLQDQTEAVQSEALAEEPQPQNPTETTQYDYDKILKGDLSDFAGNWINGFGDRRQLRADGIFFSQSPEGLRAYGFTYENDPNQVADGNAHKWVNEGEDFGYMVLLYPVGVDIKNYDQIVQTDKTQVRLFVFAHDWGAFSDGVFYMEN
ncbi:MAG: hypothetical protein LBH07_01380 [Treponema sp.]|nr:hypothetical protein [Treponema sp.]